MLGKGIWEGLVVDLGGLRRSALRCCSDDVGAQVFVVAPVGSRSVEGRGNGVTTQGSWLLAD
jgi:hypothetical protein